MTIPAGRWCLAVALLAAVSCSSPPVPTTDQVRISTGILEGIAGNQPGVRAFLGIPYAAPPVGPLRWAPPAPAAAWDGVRKADAFGNRCIQTTPFPDMVWQSAGESEDCLTLSVWTPAQGAAENLPVMVWIHGGGFFSGSSDEKRHDGSVLASHGVVVVTLNYRLGLFGFMAHPELTAESARRASGNYGLLDQIAALHWVHDNISQFGGNPGNVTIFGESAGSFAVSALMASSLARGLFHKAIGESGAYFGSSGLTLLSLADAERRGLDLAKAAGAGSIADLRARTPAALIAAAGPEAPRFSPILDGHVLAGDPRDTFAGGAQSHVPLLAGWNSAELKLPPTTAAAFEAQTRAQYPEHADAILAAYPAGTDREATLSAIALASDNFVGYGTWKWIEMHAATGDSAVYRYLFDHVVPTADGDPPPDDPGAGHATEIEFVFGTLDSRPLAWRDVDRRVSDMVVRYWTNFAKTGDPNGEGLASWPAWEANGRHELMRLAETAKAEPEAHRDRYEVLDAIYAERRR